VKTMLLSIEKMETLGWKPCHNSKQSIEAAVEALLGRR
jgi:hypothetical protein